MKGNAMAIRTEQNSPLDGAALEADMQSRQLYTMQLDVPPVNNAAHWHSFDAEFLVVAGHLSLTDAGSQRVHECPPGTRVWVPAESLHAEQSDQGYAIVLGTSVPPEEFGDPVDRPPETLS